MQAAHFDTGQMGVARLSQLIAIGTRIGLSAKDVRKHWRICQRFTWRNGKAMQKHHVLPKHLFKKGEEALRDDPANLVRIPSRRS